MDSIRKLFNKDAARVQCKEKPEEFIYFFAVSQNIKQSCKFYLLAFSKQKL